MAKALAPEVRARFAQRLKTLRVQKGFLRARYFAKSLGIEENRYTRYERAEVEPDLTLLQKMCEALRVTPNELIGFAEYGGQPSATAFTEEAGDYAGGDRFDRQLGMLAWRLASEAAAIRNKQRPHAKGAADPLAVARETGKLFQQLQTDPFGMVAAIAADEDLKKLDARRKAELAELITSFTDLAAQAASDTVHH
jgi:transcriptional regulator with XRE-family HTH domain